MLLPAASTRGPSLLVPPLVEDVASEEPVEGEGESEGEGEEGGARGAAGAAAASASDNLNVILTKAGIHVRQADIDGLEEAEALLGTPDYLDMNPEDPLDFGSHRRHPQVLALLAEFHAADHPRPPHGLDLEKAQAEIARASAVGSAGGGAGVVTVGGGPGRPALAGMVRFSMALRSRGLGPGVAWPWPTGRLRTCLQVLPLLLLLLPPLLLPPLLLLLPLLQHLGVETRVVALLRNLRLRL